MRGRAAGEPELAADRGGLLEQRDRGAGLRRLERGGDPGGSAADHEHVAARPHGGARQRALPPRARVDHAADRHARVVVADAALVAADAGDHLVAPAVRRLGHELGIGDQRPGHPHRVGGAAGDEPLRGAHVHHLRRADHGHVDGRADGGERRGEGVRARGRERHDPARGGEVRRVPEDERGEVDLPAGAQLAGELRAGGGVHALGRQLVGGEADADGELRPRAVAHRGQHLAREAQRRRVGVLAPVRDGREELRDQVAVRHRDLDPVHAALPAVARGGRVALEHRVDLRGGQRARLGHVPGRGDRGGRDRRRARRGGDLLPPAVEELHEQLRPVRVQRAGELLVAVDDGREEAAERVRGQQAAGVDRGGLDEDPAHAAAGAGLVVGDQVRGREVVVDQARLVRGRDDAVGQRHRAEVDGSEELHGPTLREGAVDNVSAAGGDHPDVLPPSRQTSDAVPAPPAVPVDPRSRRCAARARAGELALQYGRAAAARRAPRSPPRAARSDRSIAARSGASPRASQSAR